MSAVLNKNYNKGYLNPKFELQYENKWLFSPVGRPSERLKHTDAIFSARVFYNGDWS